MKPCATLPSRGTAAWAGGDRVKAHYLSNREAKVARQYAAGLITKQAELAAQRAQYLASKTLAKVQRKVGFAAR